MIMKPTPELRFVERTFTQRILNQSDKVITRMVLQQKWVPVTGPCVAGRTFDYEDGKDIGPEWRDVPTEKET